MAGRQLLLAKKETVYGTDATAAAIDTMLAEDVSFRLTGQRVKPNPAKPGVGPVASHVYGEHVEMSFKVPLAASGKRSYRHKPIAIAPQPRNRAKPRSKPTASRRLVLRSLPDRVWRASTN
ncbi:MAG: hypothetical protein ACK4YQ_16950 [Phenylobacterium sp.]|uniref:hypothetical protein n=1 Tax=Phenylobacterium sp. TaxID=1871053 RepID=UPI00391CA480